MTIAIPIDGPGVQVVGQSFASGLNIITQPTYGRVLFTEPDGCHVYGCRFDGGLYIGVGVRNVVIECNRFSNSHA